MGAEYRLVRSSRRTLALEITRQGEVVVRAPRRTSQRTIDRFVTKQDAWIAEHLQRQSARLAAEPPLTPEEEAALRQRAKEELPQRAAHFAGVMGVVPAGIKITSAKARFGSCGPQNNLCFSWRLMRYPQTVIDYVVVHELAHIVHKDHSRAFYGLVASVLPDYQARWARLKLGPSPQK